MDPQVLDHWGTDVATYGFFMGLFVTGASVKDGALFGALFEAELAGPMTAQLFSSGPDALDVRIVATVTRLVPCQRYRILLSGYYRCLPRCRRDRAKISCCHCQVLPGGGALHFPRLEQCV